MRVFLGSHVVDRWMGPLLTTHRAGTWNQLDTATIVRSACIIYSRLPRVYY